MSIKVDIMPGDEWTLDCGMFQYRNGKCRHFYSNGKVSGWFGAHYLPDREKSTTLTHAKAFMDLAGIAYEEVQPEPKPVTWPATDADRWAAVNRLATVLSYDYTLLPSLREAARDLATLTAPAASGEKGGGQ